MPRNAAIPPRNVLDVPQGEPQTPQSEFEAGPICGLSRRLLFTSRRFAASLRRKFCSLLSPLTLRTLPAYNLPPCEWGP